jgi:hypothetical protein
MSIASLKLLLASAILISLLACSTTPDHEILKWQLDYDVGHGRSIDRIHLSTAKAYTRKIIREDQGRTVWLFEKPTTGCKFEYVTDIEGRGIAYKFVSQEELCTLDSKFSGW